jgi:hypothetical protein
MYPVFYRYRTCQDVNGWICCICSTKNAWKKMVNKAVDEYWIEPIKKMSTYFKSLGYLNASNYSNGKAHAALASVQTSARDNARLPVKLRLLTGTYYLQSNKAAFNQNRIDPTCLVCHMEPETLEHFLLDCKVLAETREPYISELNVLIKERHACVKLTQLPRDYTMCAWIFPHFLGFVSMIS